MLFTSPWLEVNRLAFLGKWTQVWFRNTLTTLFHAWENGRHGAEQLSPGKHLERRPLCLHVMLHNLCAVTITAFSLRVCCTQCVVCMWSLKPTTIRGERDGCLHIVHVLHMRKARLLRSNDLPQGPKMVAEEARVWMCSLWTVPWDLWERLGQQILKTFCSIYQVFSPTRAKTSGISRSPGHFCFCLIETNSGGSWGSEG